MKIRHGKLSDKNNFIITQKGAFSNINVKRETDFFAEKIKNRELFVLEENSRYIGHISFTKYRHDPLFTDSIVIDEFVIKKNSQNKGYGTALMKKIVDYCKKRRIKIMYLSTADTKTNKAKKYYERQGFRKIGWLKNINPNSECDHDHLIYGVLPKSWRI